MLSGVQTGDGTLHDKYNIRGIAHARTNRKDDIFMQRQLVQNFTFILEWGQGTCSLTKHTKHWAYSKYFFPCMLPTPLCGIFFLLRLRQLLCHIEVSCNVIHIKTCYKLVRNYHHYSLVVCLTFYPKMSIHLTMLQSKFQLRWL